MLKQTPYTAAGGRVLIRRLWKNHGADDDNGLHQRRESAVPAGCLHHLHNYRDRRGILLIVGFQARIVAAVVAIFLSPLIERSATLLHSKII
jgi:hypothetical protein